MNDGACDSRGRFWAGTMHVDEVPGAGSLYRLDATGRVETMLGNVTVSNGIGWSPDDTVMYYVDTPTLGVDAFDYDAATGAISNRRRLATIEGEGKGPAPCDRPTDPRRGLQGRDLGRALEGWAVRR